MQTEVADFRIFNYAVSNQDIKHIHRSFLHRSW